MALLPFPRVGYTSSPPATPLLAEQSILESAGNAAVSHRQLQGLAGSTGPRPPPGSQHPEGSPQQHPGAVAVFVR